MIMVKPGLPYLDIVWRLKDSLRHADLRLSGVGRIRDDPRGGANGWIDGDRAMMESLIAFKRAGADGILTYFAPFAAEMLKAVTPARAAAANLRHPDARRHPRRGRADRRRRAADAVPAGAAAVGADRRRVSSSNTRTCRRPPRSRSAARWSSSCRCRRPSGSRGVIAMSAGNHAQAVAYHAQRLGIPATIVMPRPTPFVKIAATRGFGARSILEGETLVEAQAPSRPDHRARPARPRPSL